MRELAPAEYLLVASLRRWVWGLRQNDGAQWHVVSVEFAGTFGAAASHEALAAFGRAVHVLHLDPRQPVRCHLPCCPCLAPYEACFMLLIAACQNGDARLARAVGGWLVGEDSVGDLIQPAATLSRAMRRRGLLLPQRWQTPPVHAAASPAIDAGQTLH
jgi:hypothetical protein